MQPGATIYPVPVDRPPIELLCASRVPYPSAAWSHNGVAIPQEDGSQYQVTSNGSLVINSPTNDNRGVYTCSDQDGNGDTIPVNEVYVAILGRFYIWLFPSCCAVLRWDYFKMRKLRCDNVTQNMMSSALMFALSHSTQMKMACHLYFPEMMCPLRSLPPTISTFPVHPQTVHALWMLPLVRGKHV